MVEMAEILEENIDEQFFLNCVETDVFTETEADASRRQAALLWKRKNKDKVASLHPWTMAAREAKKEYSFTIPIEINTPPSQCIQFNIEEPLTGGQAQRLWDSSVIMTRLLTSDKFKVSFVCQLLSDRRRWVGGTQNNKQL